MQGIFIAGRRPKSKKEIKEMLADPITSTRVRLEATSAFGNEYDGPVVDAPDGSYTFVGPDPFTKRNFYGTIVKRNGKVAVK